MAETQYESDQFLKLLTDALRAGPGSPQWHEAVVQLRAMNPGEADEYQMIVTAREDLESGKEYRSIRPGPGFTRKVMQRLDEEEGGKTTALPSANIIALLAAGAIIGILIIVGVIVMRGTSGQRTVQDLANTYMGSTVASADFGSGLPLEWKTFGLEPVISTREKGMRGGYSKEDEKEYKAGGLYLTSGVPADQPFQLDATLRMVKPTDQVVFQLLVTDRATFAENARSTTTDEFVVYLDKGQVTVVRQGSVVGSVAQVPAGKPIQLSIKIDKQFVVVESDKRQLYMGEHGLSPEQQRYPGVRFLTRGAERAMDDVTVQSLRILKP